MKKFIGMSQEFKSSKSRVRSICSDAEWEILHSFHLKLVKVERPTQRQLCKSSIAQTLAQTVWVEGI